MDFDFVERLRKAMEEKCMTASELSRASGVGKSDISYYLKGKYLPKQDKVFMLAKAHCMNTGWLMSGIEQVAEEPRRRYIADSEKWRLIITNMTIEDYEMVRDAFNRTERRLHEEGKI